MSEPIDSDLRFAILIDADNVSDKYIKIILEEVANSGIATYKRIYGDWTSQRLTSWKNVLLENSIIPMQQYSYTYGKSSTDSAMIIDAMDILYSGNVDGFAIVSSDSDFTRLAARLRESGMQVIGMGEQKTPQPFISACNSFKYLDLLYAARMAEEVDDDDADEGSSRAKSRKRTRSRGGKRKDADVEKPEAETVPEDASADVDGTVPRRRPGDNGGVPVDYEAIADDDDDPEEVPFGEMSKADRRRHLKKIRESINAVCDKFSDDDGWVRNYGFKKLRPFLKSLGAYEFDEPSADNGQRQIYLRVRE